MSNPELEAPSQPPAERPEWLEGNFTSVEAQARAYADARREMGQAQARATEVEQAAQYYMERAAELEELAAQAQQPQLQDDPAQFNPLLAQFEAARVNDDLKTELGINLYASSQLIDQKIDQLRGELANRQESPVANEYYALQAASLAREQYDSQYGEGEWDASKQEAAQWLMHEHPELIPETLSPSEAAERLVMAAEYVQGRKMLTASEQERNQFVAARQQRLMAQTARGSGTPPPTVETDEERWNAIANASQRDYNSIRNGR